MPKIKKLQVISLPLKQIRPYWRNPRANKTAVSKVKKSIQDYGYNQPIAVDRKHVIIAGHARYLALRELGIEKVPVIVLDLDAKKARAYRIADNKTSEFAEWTPDLALELRAHRRRHAVVNILLDDDDGNTSTCAFGNIFVGFADEIAVKPVDDYKLLRFLVLDADDRLSIAIVQDGNVEEVHFVLGDGVRIVVITDDLLDGNPLDLAHRVIWDHRHPPYRPHCHSPGTSSL